MPSYDILETFYSVYPEIKDPQGCPYCNAECGYNDSWGASPEYWEEKWKEHLKNHCDVCPTCKQPIMKCPK